MHLASKSCRVVGDMMRSAGNRLGSVKELESYIRRPRNITSNMAVRPFIPPVMQRVLPVAACCPYVFTQGLESLLCPAHAVALESSIGVVRVLASGAGSAGGVGAARGQ